MKHFQTKEYAEQFMEGKLYLNSLGFFRAINKGASIDTQNKQNDVFEGSVPIKKDSLTNQVYSALGDIDKYLAYDPVFIFEEYKYFHLLCCSTIDFDQKGYTIINSQMMTEFGNYHVLVYNRVAFQDRIVNAISQFPDFFYQCGKVRYHNPTLYGTIKQPIQSISLSPQEGFSYYEIGSKRSCIRDCFDKSSSYSHQREWRLILYKNTWNINPFTLDVGDLSDIATLVTFDNLENKIKELNSQSLFKLQDDFDQTIYGNVTRKSLREIIITQNPNGNLAFHIG